MKFMNLMTRNLLLCLFAMIAMPIVNAGEKAFSINVDDWARPRSGERLAEFDALKELVTAWSSAPAGSVIEIHYPGGDEGALWAAELNSWLVALGIASSHIHLRSGTARIDQIELVIVEPRQ